MHSPSSVRFEDHFADLTDPRRRKVVYPLVNIVAIAICAVIAGVQYDILSVAGPEYAIRRDLLDFVVAELSAREAACPNRIRPVRTMLENQGDNLLAFTAQLDRDLTNLAQDWQISVATAREVLQVQYLPTWDSKRWPRVAALRETLRGRYHGVCAAVWELSDRVVRASSMVENLNRRLSAAKLLLPAAPVRERLLDFAPVFPEPPPVSAQRRP
jgi:DDE_Tnp_1-associated